MNKFLRWIPGLIGRSLAQNKLRTLLTILGIALGVAILLAINLANEMALSNFKTSINRVSGSNNLTIYPTQSDVLDETLLNQLGWIWLVPGKAFSHFSPGIEQTALWADTQTVSDPANPPPVIRALGVDMLSNLQADDADSMKLSASSGNSFDILKPYHAYVGEVLARQRQLKPGSHFDLYLNDGITRFTVAGILSRGELGDAYGGQIMVMDLSTAQQAFGLRGLIHKIDIRVPEESVAAVQDKLKAQLPQGVTVQRPAQKGEQVEKMVRSYQYNLTTLSFIALLVGVFLIYNTMSITIIRRRSEIGTLRAIGFSRRHIFGLFVTEALLIGLLGTLLGLGFGVFLSQFAIKAIATTVAALYTGQVLDQFSINPWLIVQAFGFGIIMTLLGALAPVLEATTVAPAEASRRATYESKIFESSGKLSIVGTLFLMGAVISALQPPINGLPVFGFMAALGTILGTALWLPLLLKGSLSALLPVLKRALGIEARLGGLILRGALGRTAVSVASLMIGIAMMVSLAVMISSFRQTVITWVEQTLKADLWIEPVSKFDSKQSGRIQPSAVAVIQAIPGVAAVDDFYEFPIQYHGNPTNLGVGQFQVLARHGNLQFLDNEAPQAVLKRVMAEPSVIVTEAFSTRNKVGKNSLIELATPTGLRKFRVQGVYYDYSSDLGYIVMPRQWYARFYQDNRISNLAVYLNPDTDPEAVRQAIHAKLQGKSRLEIRSNQELRENVLRIFDRTFAITYALHVIAIAVALLAVMNALFALVLEARREFGLLKYLGATNAQIGKIVMVKAGLLGFFGNTSGLAVGLALSFLLIEVINKQSFGWTIRFELPWFFLLQSFGLVMITAIVSGIIPARIAAQTPAPQVIKTE
ncbi:ABC transporter permease [Vampirovibrio chlorellavorus]|uniref:ABC transporter permease n=1 Tax=Vampirovibrio chlorellavorus TaxID=758823 RepID=UPI0026EB640C|nr:ABC transporter permease [Vampirovibrio chlorellavorus]